MSVQPLSQTLAINIVLLPPPDIMEWLISLNKHAADQGQAWARLGSHDFLPHISLAMGGIAQDKMDEVKTILAKLALQFPPITVTLDAVWSHLKKPSHENMCSLKVTPTPELQSLHEALMTALLPYFSYDCTEESLFYKPDEEKIKPEFINTYASQHSFANFDPHITLLAKEMNPLPELPMAFVVTTLAACHVGVMTTCRKMLFSAELGNV